MLDFVHRPESPRSLLEPVLLATHSPSLAILRVKIVRSRNFTHVIGPRYANAVLNVAIERVKAALHAHDSLLRMDLDEIAILLNPMHSLIETERVANEIISLLQKPYFCLGKSARLRVAIGIALSSQHGNDVETLLRCAETALKYAEVSRSATAIIYHEELESITNSRLALAADLANALRSSQMELFYQPQFSIDRTLIEGFQVSPQWRHPHYGWISPADFIPLAEDLGVMHHISTWALKSACIQVAGLPPVSAIAVAASPLQFTTGTMLGSVEDALESTGMDPHRLAIELPVQIALNDSTLVQSAIAALHKMGVRLVLSNLGSSFSPLDLLGRIPFSSVTLDSSLVSQSTQQRSIVRAATMLGRELGISVLAQGIETEQDLLEAEIDGCTSAQGPLLGGIVAASRIPEVAASLAA